MPSVDHQILPIGIQSFEKLRKGHYYYVDKTPLIHTMAEMGGYYFLSRPRRFGKSLLLDTLHCLFEGHEALFEGLYIHDKWDWQSTFPVVRLSFSHGVVSSRQDLDANIRYQLQQQRAKLNIETPPPERIADDFASLIENAHRAYDQRVVVLIDKYDKPILDNLLNPELARELREGLKNIYSVLKDADPHLHFVLLTGVSKFSKVSLFTGLNNLNDITLDAPFAAICGYTDHDIDTVFAPELTGLDREEIRRWYNGYCWGGQDVAAAYNPFDVLLLLQKREFGPYWFESATPTFLVDLLKKRGIFTPQLNTLKVKAQLLGRFDIDDITTEGLLFQTGYITIKDVQEPVIGYLRLKDRVGGDTQPLRLDIDPGSKTTGLALMRESEGEKRHVLCLFDLIHRGFQIKKALEQRRGFRRRRRSKNLRYRKPRFDKKPAPIPAVSR